MTLPTFLGIGVPRGGTTWLASHPDVAMPSRRKEVRFFDRHYDRGLRWYEAFFCPSAQAGRYRAIGEISPLYYCTDGCVQRIHSTLPEVKMLIMLRHPVSRAYSHFGFCVQRANYRGSFEEEASRDLRTAQSRVAEFLAVPVERFPPIGTRKVNASTTPTSQSLSGLAVKTGRRLRRWQLEPVVDLGRRLGAQRLISRGRPLPPLDGRPRGKLSSLYLDEFDELEQSWRLDLTVWREHQM